MPAAVIAAGTVIDGPALADGAVEGAAAVDGDGVAPPVQAPTATTVTTTSPAMRRSMDCIRTSSRPDVRVKIAAPRHAAFARNGRA